MQKCNKDGTQLLKKGEVNVAQTQWELKTVNELNYKLDLSSLGDQK